MTIDFEMFMRTMLSQAGRFLAAGQEVMATAFILSDAGVGIIGLSHMPNQTAKEVLYRKVSDEARKNRAYAVVLLNDVWVRLNDGMHLREEAIFTQLVMPDGTVMDSLTLPYRRLPAGRFEFGPIVHGSLESYQYLLPPWAELPRA